METVMMQISASTGPEECCLAVRLAFQRLMKEAALLGVRVEVLEQVPGEWPDNFRSLILLLEGPAAPSMATAWEGSLQWICASPYRPGHARKNWFFGASVHEAAVMQTRGSLLRDDDIRYETMRSGGPGGQHVNTTESAVRATHVPTGISVKVQTERSQHANRRLARALLAHKLAEREDASGAVSRQTRWQQHRSIERGNPRRVFKGHAFVDVS